MTELLKIELLNYVPNLELFCFILKTAHALNHHSIAGGIGRVAVSLFVTAISSTNFFIVRKC